MPSHESYLGADNNNNTRPPNDLRHVNIIISKWVDYFLLYKSMFGIRCLQTGNVYVKRHNLWSYDYQHFSQTCSLHPLYPSPENWHLYLLFPALFKIIIILAWSISWFTITATLTNIYSFWCTYLLISFPLCFISRCWCMLYSISLTHLVKETFYSNMKQNIFLVQPGLFLALYGSFQSKFIPYYIIARARLI